MMQDTRTPEQKRAAQANSPVMTVKQLGDYLQCHPSTIYRMLHRGEFTNCVFRVGSDHRFIKSAIDAWIAGLADPDFKEVGRKPL